MAPDARHPKYTFRCLCAKQVCVSVDHHFVQVCTRGHIDVELRRHVGPLGGVDQLHTLQANQVALGVFVQRIDELRFVEWLVLRGEDERVGHDLRPAQELLDRAADADAVALLHQVVEIVDRTPHFDARSRVNDGEPQTGRIGVEAVDHAPQFTGNQQAVQHAVDIDAPHIRDGIMGEPQVAGSNGDRQFVRGHHGIVRQHGQHEGKRLEALRFEVVDDAHGEGLGLQPSLWEREVQGKQGAEIRHRRGRATGQNGHFDVDFCNRQVDGQLDLQHVALKGHQLRDTEAHGGRRIGVDAARVGRVFPEVVVRVFGVVLPLVLNHRPIVGTDRHV